MTAKRSAHKTSRRPTGSTSKTPLPSMTSKVVGPTLNMMLEALRSRGWAVAVHNDYRMDGKRYTFWLFAKDICCVTGEGNTDEEAVALALREANRIDAWAVTTVDAPPAAAWSPARHEGPCGGDVDPSARCTHPAHREDWQLRADTAELRLRALIPRLEDLERRLSVLDDQFQRVLLDIATKLPSDAWLDTAGLVPQPSVLVRHRGTHGYGYVKAVLPGNVVRVLWLSRPAQSQLSWLEMEVAPLAGFPPTPIQVATRTGST